MSRIDFKMFDKAAEENVSGGLMCDALNDCMSNDYDLKSLVKEIEPNKNIFWVSEGKWSMHELLLEILKITGPATVDISSYAMSETPARVLAQLKTSAIIKNLNCVLDNRVDVRSAGSLQIMKTICNQLALIKTHAKVTVVRNDNWQLAVIGSANYTENERFESGVISINHDVVEMQLQWMQKAFKDANRI